MNDHSSGFRPRGLRNRKPGDAALEEVTIGIYKPDAFLTEGVSKEIAAIIKNAGLEIVDCQNIKKISPCDEQDFERLKYLLKAHYRKDDGWRVRMGQEMINCRLRANKPVEQTALQYGQLVLDRTIEYMMSGRLRVVAYAGVKAIEKLYALTGSHEPLTAAPGTIRRIFSSDSYELAEAENRAIRNLFHCSDSPEESAYEKDLWFGTNNYW